jgi:hypothetical protein
VSMNAEDRPRSKRLLPVAALSIFLLTLAVVLLTGRRATDVEVRSVQSGFETVAPRSGDWMGASPASTPGTPIMSAALAPGALVTASRSSTALTPAAMPTPSPTPYIGFISGAFADLDPLERAEIERPRKVGPLDWPLFSDTLWVGLYGTPGGRGLGVLGRYSPTETVMLAAQQAISYQVLISPTGVSVIPFFHMVTTIADPFPGADGDYVHRVSTETLSLWIDVAHDHGLVSVLDIQPGHSALTQELTHLEPFLRMEDVHLAVDPEFLMVDEAAIPGSTIGSMSGQMLNITQSWLNDLAETVGARKALVVHQFDSRMFSDKDAIEDYPWVELVWDADGFGAPGPKIADYEQYAKEPGFEHGGFKLFYNYDTPLMTPGQVLDLEPFPVFIVYQ